MLYKILAVNPGSTSTKLALYTEDTCIWSENIEHELAKLQSFSTIMAQLNFRQAAIDAILAAKDMKAHQNPTFSVKGINAVMGRGGVLQPLKSGVYSINTIMLDDLQNARYGQHASNLGAFLAHTLAQRYGAQAFIADPVVVDELEDVARISGHTLFKRKSIFHALNQKACAKRWAKENKKKYEEVCLVVAHLGGGVSIGLHRGGKVVDVNNALDGEGPFAANRSGSLPVGDLVRLCFSGKYSQDQVLEMIRDKGGFASMAGTTDIRIIEKRVEDQDAHSALLLQAFAYQVAKSIAGMVAIQSGRVDAIIVTGGIAFSQKIVAMIQNYCNFLAPIIVYPGENELKALAMAGFDAVSGKEAILQYEGFMDA